MTSFFVCFCFSSCGPVTRMRFGRVIVDGRESGRQNKGCSYVVIEFEKNDAQLRSIVGTGL